MQITIEGAEWKVDELVSKLGGPTSRAAINEAVADELQKRIPLIAQAVLDCDIRNLQAPSTPHIADAVTRPLGVREEVRWNDAILKGARAQREERRAEAVGAAASAELASNSAYSRWVAEQSAAAEAVQGLHPANLSGKAAALQPAESPVPASVNPHRGSPAQVHAALQQDIAVILKWIDRCTGNTEGEPPFADFVAAAMRINETLHERATCASVTGADHTAEDLAEYWRSRYLVHLNGLTKRLLEEEFAAPGPAASRNETLAKAAEIGLRELRARRQATTPRAISTGAYVCHEGLAYRYSTEANAFLRVP